MKVIQDDHERIEELSFCRYSDRKNEEAQVYFSKQFPSIFEEFVP
jgi:hypothetical protein